MTREQITRIEILAQTGFSTHEIQREHYPDLELWEIHNAIHFACGCRNKKDLIDRILKLYPDMPKTFDKLHKRAEREVTYVILYHESRIIESKLHASEAYRKNSRPEFPDD